MEIIEPLVIKRQKKKEKDFSISIICSSSLDLESNFQFIALTASEMSHKFPFVRTVCDFHLFVKKLATQQRSHWDHTYKAPRRHSLLF